MKVRRRRNVKNVEISIVTLSIMKGIPENEKATACIDGAGVKENS